MVGGYDLDLNKFIHIHNPTLQEIIEYGEERYDGLCAILTMRGYDDMLNLESRGIDYTKVTDYELFVCNVPNLNIEQTSILFGKQLDFTQFQLLTTPENRVILYQLSNEGEDIIIDELLYKDIVDFIRGINMISAKVDIDVGNGIAKKFLLERMAKKAKRNAKKPYRSKLANKISAIVGMGLGYNYSTILNITVSQLHDLFRRILKIEDYHNLMGAAHAGCSLKDVSKKRFEWYGDYSDE